MRRKTTEEFIEELKLSNPGVVVLGEYRNRHTKVRVICKKHEVEWDALPQSLLRGSGCVKCKSERISKSQRMTHGQFMKRYKNPKGIKILGKYRGDRNKIFCRCEVCGYEFYGWPYNISKGQGCKKCANEKMRKERTKSHDEFLSDVKKVHANVRVLGEYINSSTKIKCACETHGTEWEIKPSNLLHGQTGCKKCQIEKMRKRLMKTQDEFVSQMKKHHPSVKVLGEYRGNHTPVKCKCLKCGKVITPTPSNVLKKNNAQRPCMYCSITERGIRSRKTHDEFVEELKETLPNVEVMSEYTVSSGYVKCRCLKDGYEWESKAYHLLAGHGCSKCKSSEGEKEIARVLRNNDIEYVIQHRFEDCRHKRPLPFDFYLPEHNSVIEYDGVQHFKPIDFFGGEEMFEYRVKMDEIKNNYCKAKGIEMLRIPYTENENIENMIMDFIENKKKVNKMQLSLF